MGLRRRACLFFVGDITRDSRALRFLDGLYPEFESIAITASHEDVSSTIDNFTLFSFSSLKNKSFQSALLHYYKSVLAKTRTLSADIVIASDLYSLPIAWYAAKKKNASLMYDARELYSSIAALHDRSHAQKFWTWIEKTFAKNASVITTVNTAIADLLKRKFPRPKIEVIRNYPVQRVVEKNNMLRAAFGISSEKKIILSQGGMQEGRGALILTRALKSLSDCVLVFLGSGKLKEQILHHASEFAVADRVFIHDAVPSNDLLHYTASADVGMCLIENRGMSYYLSLPNKLFEYIAAGVPVVGSNFPEIRNVIESRGIGRVASPEDVPSIVEAVRMLIDKKEFYDLCVKNCLSAREDFSWDKEKSLLRDVIGSLKK